MTEVLDHSSVPLERSEPAPLVARQDDSAAGRLLMVSRVAAVESIVQVVQELRRALATRDASWFAERLSQKAHAVHVGKSYVMSLLSSASPTEGLGEVEIRWMRGELAVDQRGDVAWVVDMATLCFDDGSEIVLRAALVFVLDDDTWQLAHSYLCVPETDEDLQAQWSQPVRPDNLKGDKT